MAFQFGKVQVTAFLGASQVPQGTMTGTNLPNPRIRLRGAFASCRVRLSLEGATGQHARRREGLTSSALRLLAKVELADGVDASD
jgi:hypothetical protein